MKVWVVSFQCGEYSAFQTMVDCCFTTEKAADTYVLAKNAEIKQIFDNTISLSGWITKDARYAHYLHNGENYDIKRYDENDYHDGFVVDGPYEVKE